MDVRHPLYQAIASALAGILFLNPIVVAAAELAVDAAAGGNTGIGAAGNGVPVVNIATPNGAGLSHNKFSDYNVGPNGLILNNATGKTQSTQLGGIIIGNPNLKGGAAQKILNEVTGANPSQLRGYTEVAGQAAHVIVANPHGITCNGCGFINTPRATLTTGKPILDGERLQGYDVNGGEISIEGAGLNASNIDQFELITRSAKLNADLYAKQLAVVTGRNQVDAESLAATAKADDGSAKPQLAIDSSALGGMYAGAIRLVGTEQGVGVKLAGNMAASAGDIQIDANGQLSLAQTSTAGSLRAKAQDIALNGPAYAAGAANLEASGKLSVGKSLAGQNVDLKAVQLTNDGQIVSGIDGDQRIAGKSLSITAANLENRGRLDATGSLNVTGSTLDNSGQAYAERIAVTASQRVDNRGTLQARDVSLTTAQFNNLGASAQLIGEQSLLLNAPAVANLGGLIRFADGQAANLQFSTLDNSGGRLEVNGGSLTLSGGSLTNQQGRIVGGSTRIDAQSIDNTAGLIGSSQGDLTLSSQGALNNAGGKLQAARDLTVNAGAVDNTAGTLVGDNLRVTAGSLDNRQGGVVSAEQGDLSLQLSGAFDNSSGRAQASASLLLDAGSIANAAGTLVAQSLTLTAQGSLDNAGGTLAAKQLSITAQDFGNQNGKVQAETALTLDADDLDNTGGLLLGGTLQADLGSLSSNAGGTLSADGLLKLTVARALNNALGRMQSTQGNIEVIAGSLDNSQGTLAGGQLLLQASGLLDNRGGRIVGDRVQANAHDIDNSDQGLLVAGADGLELTATQRLSNNQGRIQSDTGLQLTAAQLENRGGVVLGKRIEVTGGSLDNSQGGALVSNGDQVRLTLDGVLNNATGVIDAGDQAVVFTRAASQLVNRGGTVRGERLDVLAGSVDNSAAGRLLAGAAGLSVQASGLNNQQGLVYAQGGDTVIDLGSGTLQNQAGTVQGDTVTVTAASLDNSQANGEAGIVASLIGKLQLTVGNLINRGGQLFGKGDLGFTGNSLDNAGGQISGGQVVLNGTGTLNNQGGLIESASTLELDSGALDNTAGGRLRALGGDSSRIHTSGKLNNQGGNIGIASRDFELDSDAALLNSQGYVQHAGTGVFRLGAGNLTGAGSLTGLGSGEWHVGSLAGVGQMRLNGGLNLTVDQGLDIAAGERIASASGLTITATYLNNQGELLSDGDLGLTLSGDATNSGTLSAQRNLTLGAGNFTQQGGRLASGLDTQLNLTGNLNNQGWLIANQALRANAAQITNNGTLGALGALNLTSGSINNGADSLLFSGGDMTLRAASLSNRYGDLYSQGNLSFANIDGSRAQSFSNRSGTIEAVGDINLDVASLENTRDVFAFEQTTTYGEFDVQCGQHCDGHDSFKRGKINVNETIEERITQNSPSAWLTSGRNLTINADAVENRNSVIAANGDLTINANSLLNQGNASRTGNKVVVVNTVQGGDGKIDTDDWDHMEYGLAKPFNEQMAAGTFNQSLYDQLWAIYNQYPWLPGTPVITWSEDGAQSAPATLQAGNRVNLNVAQNLQNGTVTEYSYAQLTGQLAGSLLGQQVGTVNLTINKQSSDAQARGPQTVQSVTRTDADGSQQISFIPVDYTGVPFAAVDPTAADTFRLPQGQYGMFIRTTTPGANYLIETNPALTDLGKFLNSDYLLGKLGFDADKAWKRLGDGAYETRLIREAIQASTGQRFLDGLASDYDQFQYLMDNALAAKDALKLSVGVGLSAEQVAALTHDIVWMETRVVDGQEVLVPVVYLAQTDARNLRGGSLIQGRDLNLMAGGNLVNVGTLRASNDLSATAGGSILQGGLVDAGQRVSLLAGDSIRNALAGQIRGDQIDLTALRGDIVNDRTAVTSSIGGSEYKSFLDTGSSISARSELSLDAGRDITNRGSLASGGDAYIGAGRDINLDAVTDASHLRDVQKGGHHVTTTSVEKNYGSSLTAGGDLILDAGRDLNVTGSQASAKGDLTASASRDINLRSVEDSAIVEVRSKTSNSRTLEQTGQTRQSGAELSAGGDLLASAGQDMNLSASTISASNEAYLYAARDVNLQSAEETDSHALSKTKRSRGLLSSSEKKTEDSSLYTTQAGSLVSADKIAIRAGQDIGVSGSDVASTNGTSLLAGRNVLIDGATESTDTRHAESKKKSGVMSSGGIGFTVGSASSKATDTNHTEQTRGSTIGSVLGNVDIQAGKDLTVRGSDVIAGKNINLIGQNVSILAAQNENRSEQTREEKKSGLTLALSGSVGSAMDAGYQTAKEAKHEDDSRLSALQGIKAGLTGVQAWQAAQQGNTADGASQFFGISASLGSQKSSSQQTQQQSVSQGSSLNAGNNLNILATGSGAVGQDGDIHIQGSQLKAGNDMLLAANRDITLEAAANTQKLDGKNKSSGGAVGVSLGYSTSGGAGLSIFANANQGSGKEIGTGTTWTETTLDAGNKVSLVSGRDTALIGAQVNGEQIIANVGRDLTLKSLQDSDYYDSKQKNVSGGASVTVIGTGGGSANFSASQSKIDSNYKSVQEQTGLYAGKGGFQIDVGNHTQLDGAVISSTADADKNHLSTGTLGWSSLDNKADYKSQQQSVSVSSGSDGSGEFISNMPSGMLVAYNHGDSASGTTGSAISAGTIEIRDQANQQQDVASLSRDVENANGSISPIFDKEKEQRRLQEVQLIAQIGSQSMDIIRTEGERKATEAGSKELDEKGTPRPGANATAEEIKAYNDALANTKAYQDVMRQYGTGSEYQKAAQAVTAALQYLAGGDIGGAVAGASAPYVAKLIKDQTGNNGTARIMAQAVLGAIVASAQGNSGAAGAAGAATGELIAASLYPNKTPQELTENERQIVSALSTLAAGMAGGLVAGDSAGVAAAAGAGKTAVENNAISDIAEEQMTGVSRAEKYEKALAQLKIAEEEYKAQVCAGLGAAACSAKMDANRAEMFKGAASLGADFVPVVGDIKSFAEAQSSLDYLAAVIGIVPVLGDIAGTTLKAAQKSLKAGDVEQASKLINIASDQIQAEKSALDRIAQNPKGVDLAGKQPNSVLQQQSQKRIDELAVQYNTKSIETKDFQLNLGGKVLKADPQVSKGAPVYEGATTSDVMSYFKQLAGVESMPAAKVVPGKGTIYTIQTGSGSKMTLRDFSTSSQQTGASWTIDVRDNAINGGRAVELKFK